MDAESDRLREHRGVAGAIPAEGFLVHHDRDSQPGAFHHQALDGVHELGAFVRSEARGGADASDLADPVGYDRQNSIGVKVIAPEKVR